ncbi:hypothetical protein BDFB_015296, partial [Asbolus verrucosus]
MLLYGCQFMGYTEILSIFQIQIVLIQIVSVMKTSPTSNRTLTCHLDLDRENVLATDLLFWKLKFCFSTFCHILKLFQCKKHKF